MCPDGFLLGSDWRTCEDVDECEAADACGEAEVCVNTAGGHSCRPRDACREDNGGCSHGCLDAGAGAGARCSCPRGMELARCRRSSPPPH